MAKEAYCGEGVRKQTSLLMTPEIARRLKVCAAKLGVSRSKLIERFCEAGLPEAELQGLADEGAAVQKDPKIRSCNRHSNCEKAEKKYEKEEGKPPWINFHCHDECCEDCFGS